jgi:TrmH family RNA methyltransferase
VIEEALAAGFSVEELFLLEGTASLRQLERRARSAGVEVTLVSQIVLDALATTTTPQGAVAVVAARDCTLDELPEQVSLALVLAQIRDPGNAGTLVRSAVAAGAEAVVFSTGSVDAFGPKTLRAAAGTIFSTTVVEDVSLGDLAAALKRRGVRLVGADAAAATPIYEIDLTDPVGYVLGNEAWGLDAEASEIVDTRVMIPMPGPAESLNVAAAGTVLLFETSRQRLGVSSRGNEVER